MIFINKNRVWLNCLARQRWMIMRRGGYWMAMWSWWQRVKVIVDNITIWRLSQLRWVNPISSLMTVKFPYQHLHYCYPITAIPLLLDWRLWILVWELEDRNREYFGIQLCQCLPDTALTLLIVVKNIVQEGPLSSILVGQSYLHPSVQLTDSLPVICCMRIRWDQRPHCDD